MALDFPSTPTDGQVYDNFYYDSAKGTWKSLSSGVSPSILVNPTITDGVITATAPNSTTVPLTVKGAASQSAKLQEWRDSSGAVLSSINSDGNLTVSKIGLGGRPVHATYFLDATGRMKIRSDGTDSPGIWFTGSGGTETPFFGLGGTTSNDALGIWHNAAWRLQVDNNGRVTMPYQPAFSVQGTGTQAWSGAAVATKVVMNGSVLINRGSYYSTTNSRFTAPVAGAYQFHMSSAITTNNTGPEIYVYKNGALTVGNLAIGYDALYNTFGGTTILDLVAGDYVEMYINNNNGTSFTVDRTHTLFSGFLIG